MSERQAQLTGNVQPRVRGWKRVAAVGALGIAGISGLTACGDGLPLPTRTVTVPASAEAAGGTSTAPTSGVTVEAAPTPGTTQPEAPAPVQTTEAAAPVTHAPAPRGTQTHPAAVPKPPSKPYLTFNSRGSDLSRGGSNVIEIYANDQPGGQGSNDGTYMSGQTAPIECMEEGRSVSTVPSEGEQSVTTDVWFKIDAPQGELFATGAYGDPSISVGQIPKC